MQPQTMPKSMKWWRQWSVSMTFPISSWPQSVIQEQVEMGVAVRMAVMEALLDPRRNEGRDA